MTYEEACALSGNYTTVEKFNEYGSPQLAIKAYNEELMRHGWSTDKLMKEAELRMKQRIKQLKKEKQETSEN